jgi:hypothetical protein
MAKLAGSVFVAMLVGVVEGSSLSTTILTDLPWCLTLGMIADMLLHRTIGYAGTKLAIPTSEETYSGVEKEVC